MDIHRIINQISDGEIKFREEKSNFGRRNQISGG